MKKIKIALKVTNKNIKKRFELQKKEDSEFTLKEMGDMFEVHYKLAWSWVTSNKKHQRLPNDKKRCSHCGFTQWELVEEWINEKGIKI